MAKKQIKFRIENSAPSQKRPAKAVRWSAPILQAEGVQNVADVGCGRFRNLGVLIKHFPKITLVDTPYQCERIRPLLEHKKHGITLIDNVQFEASDKKFDGIFCISVIHTIPKIEERDNIVMNIYRKLKIGGFFVLDVPVHETYYARKCTKENEYEDGWYMGTGPYYTFYKDYTAKELDEFVSENRSFEMFGKNNQIKHVTRIFRKRSSRKNSG